MNAKGVSLQSSSSGVGHPEQFPNTLHHPLFALRYSAFGNGVQSRERRLAMRVERGYEEPTNAFDDDPVKGVVEAVRSE